MSSIETFWVLLTHEPASLWRENVIAVVNLLRVLARMSLLNLVLVLVLVLVLKSKALYIRSLSRNVIIQVHFLSLSLSIEENELFQLWFTDSRHENGADY